MKSGNERFSDPLSAAFKKDWRVLLLICVAMMAVGWVTFTRGIARGEAQRVWQAYLINFLFWSGLAFGSGVFAAALNITKARWARPIKRLAEAPIAFLPFSLLFFYGLYQGRHELFHWIQHPVAGKAWWLNARSLFIRDGIGLGLLTAACLLLLFCSVREDRRFSRAAATAPGSAAADATPPAEPEALAAPGWRAQLILSPVIGILYAGVLSLVAVDLIMALDPHWVSTLFPAYYFIGSLYSALALLVVLTAYAMQTEQLGEIVGLTHLHDLGKLLLGFCLVTGDFFYSQFLVIWYGNLPEDARYVILRVRQSPWEILAWTVLLICFVLPFLSLLSRKIKARPKHMVALGGMILVGMWLERMLLVAPSLQPESGLPVGFLELFISIGFVGTMGFSLLLFFHLVPLIPVADPLYQRYLHLTRLEGEGHFLPPP